MRNILSYKKLVACCLLLAFLLACAACGSEKNAPVKSASGDADKAAPKELRVCSSLGEDITQLLANDFAGQSGMTVSVQYLPAGSLAQRQQFLRAGGFDVWLGGTAEEYYLAHREKLLEPYLARESYKAPVTLRNKDGHWTSLYLGYIGLISNKEKLHRFRLYAPETWDELLEPQLAGEIAVPDYNAGGASYGMLTSIWQMRGKPEALQYAARFNAQRPQLTPDAAAAANLVYSGQKTVAVVPLAYALALEAQHPHLFATVIKDANRNLLTGAALLAQAPNPQGGRQFLDYLMSDESEALLKTNGYPYLWHVKNYPDNVGRKELIGRVQVPVDDLGWTSVYKSEVIRQWNEAR